MEIKHEIEEVESKAAVEAREKFESSISNIWGHSSVGLEAKKAAMTMLSTKSGLYAKIPITCKADNCPYASTCALLPYGLAPMGEKCPMETAQIELRYSEYFKDYDLDNASFTDRTLVSELVNIDIMLERTKALLSAEEVPITEVVAGMTESGEEYTRPEISKAFELYERNLNRKDKILDSMLGTRKSKKGTETASESVQDILAQAIDIDFVEDKKPDNI